MARRRMPSVMKHRFSEVPAADIKRSVFDRSHGHKTTFDAGYLIPIFLDEVLPGDTFTMKHSFVCRMATPIFPLMDNLFLDIHYFYVPTRLLWDSWEEFCGYADGEYIASPLDPVQENPIPTKAFPIAPKYFVPHLKGTPSSVVTSGSLADYLGLPVGLKFDISSINGDTNLPDNGPFVSALPFVAYNQIYDEWYRDENLIPPLPRPSVFIDGATGNLNYSEEQGNVGKLWRRGKRHDYFTSCLPWPAKGPKVTLPLSGEAPVKGIGFWSAPGYITNSDVFNNKSGNFFETQGKTTNDRIAFNNYQSNSSYVSMFVEGFKAPGQNNYYLPNIRADLGAVNSVTINELRQAFQVQKLYERDARGGTRYVEVLRSHFGVTSPDARLQRPEYLGGSSSPIHVAPIPQTSATQGNSPQGNLSAYAVANDSKTCFSKSFVEHGYILGIASVRSDLMYQQGLDRIWSRKTRFDYYWPTLAHLGEQAVLNQEIFFNTNYNTSTDGSYNKTPNEGVFGYQERYAEYRYKNSLVTGGMRAGVNNSYAAWHLAQQFTEVPKLNQSFIEESPPMDRVLALGSNTRGRQFIFDGFFKLRCVRPMPVYSVPGLVDHF